MRKEEPPKTCVLTGSGMIIRIRIRGHCDPLVDFGLGLAHSPFDTVIANFREENPIPI